MGDKSRNVATSVVHSSGLATDEYLDLRLGDFLDRLSADGLAPGGGSAAALTVAFAARLVCMVARCSVSWSDAPGVAAQANAIAERAVQLAHTDGRAWEAALTALRDAEAGEGVGDPKRSFALERKLEAAAAAPLEIASLGADAASLAAIAGEQGEAMYRPDATAAAALAAGGAAAATHLVRVNLGMRTSDPRLAQALASEQAAQDVAARLLEAPR
jgi:formiminotetrahydrofolate cyclodeaminase